jgi:hypothetical protein
MGGTIRTPGNVGVSWRDGIRTVDQDVEESAAEPDKNVWLVYAVSTLRVKKTADIF